MNAMPRRITSQISFMGLNSLTLDDRSVLATQILQNGADAKWLVNFLVTLLKHPNPNLCRFACGYLGSSGSVRAYRAVHRVFADPDSEPRLRRMAGNALGSLHDVGKSRDIIRILSSIFDEDLLIAGVNALGYYTDRRSEKYLIGVVRDPSASPIVRAYAAESLGLHSRRAVKALIATTDDGPLEARFFAARALGWIGDKRAILALNRMAASDTDILGWKPVGGSLANEAKLAIEAISKGKRNG